MCDGFLLNHLRLRVSVFFSPAHGAQRAMWGGVQACGKYAFLLIACAVVNLERGPWNREAKHQQIRESTLEWQAKASTDRQDPLLRFILPRHLEAAGKDRHDVSEEDIDAIVEGITECNFYRRKMPKTALTQWNTLNDSLETLLPEWWLKVLALLHLGVMQGWCKGTQGAQLLSALKPADMDVVRESFKSKESTSVSHAKVRRMRDGCLGSMKLVTFTMLDPDFKADLEMICFVTSPWRRFHGQIQKDLTSPKGAMEFHTDIVFRRGAFWHTMAEAMTPFTDLERLQRIGFVVDISVLPPSRLAVDSPDMQAQSKLALSLWLLIFAEFEGFFKKCVHFFGTYPGKFALLLGPEDTRAQHFDDLRKDYHAFLQAKSRPQPMLRRICRRSVFNWIEVEEMLTYNGGLCHEDMRKHALRMFGHFGDTTLIEKHWQVKSDQCKDPASRKIAPATLWRGPVREKVLSEVFKYGREVSVNDVLDDMSARASLPQSLYRNQLSKKVTSMDFSALPSKAEKSPWERYSYDTWPAMAVESIFLRVAFDQGKLADVEQAWRTQFLRPGMVVQGPDKAIVVVMSFMPPMALCWKVTSFMLGGSEFYTFDLSDGAPTLEYKVIWSFDDWRLRLVQWCAPIHLLRANGFRQFETFPQAFCVAEPGGWVQFLQHCACKGFWDISESAVNMLSRREFGIEPCAKFLDTLIALICKILACDEESAVRCIEHRMAYFDLLTNEYEDVLETDEFYEAVDDDTRQSAAKYVERRSGAVEIRTTMQGELLHRMRKIRQAKAEAAASGPIAKRPKVAKPAGKYKKVLPSPLPADEALFTADFVQGLCPPGTKVNRDIFNGRWQLYWRLHCPPPGPWRSISRSWGCRQQSECVRECLQAVWRWAQAEQDIECPVADLFQAESASTSGAASSSSSRQPV